MTDALSPQAKLEAVREKIVEANPNPEHDTAGLWWCTRPWDAWDDGTMRKQDFEPVQRPIRLADVLLTIGMEQIPLEASLLNSRITCHPGVAYVLNVLKRWNLRRDSLDQQSEETIDFLHSVLCV